MAHPHKGKAAESSREKFRAITGRRGGGHAHAGASHNKRAGQHGVLHTYDSHTKGYHPEAKAHGGRSKPRADRYARGGRTGGPRNVTINISAAQPGGPQMPPPMLPAPTPPPTPAAPPMPPPSSPPGGAMGAAGAGGGANPMGGLGKGLGFRKGGRVAHATKAQPGDTRYDMAHWKKHAADGRVTKAKRIVQGHTQSVDKVQERARGGRMKMTAGAMSGVGRLEQASHMARKR